jgi:hypothetical protein
MANDEEGEMKGLLARMVRKTMFAALSKAKRATRC